jgi:ASC-1-like (ASCH) protein
MVYINLRQKEFPEKKISIFDSILIELSSRLENDPYWQSDLFKLQNTRISLHLAIVREPYLSLVLEGQKTIETRFSIHRQAPYEQIDKEDIILLKQPSGPIIGLCQVSDAWFYKLNQNSWHIIKNDFFKEILIQDQQFWDDREDASYATLIRVQHVLPLIPPINCPKRDRRGWVVLMPRNYNTKLIP